MGHTVTPPQTPLRPFVPAFANGTTGGASGTVTDGAQLGRVTLSVPDSGHTDPSDGCWIAWPARDLLGRLLPGLGDPIQYLRAPHGLVYADVVTAPDDSKGVRLWVGVIAAPAAADVDSTDAHGFAGELDMASTRTLSALRVSASGWTRASGPSLPSAQDDRVGSAGDLLQTPVAVSYAPTTGQMDQSRFIGNEDPLLPGNAGSDLFVAVGAYRAGSSTGSATVTVDVRARLFTVETA